MGYPPDACYKVARAHQGHTGCLSCWNHKAFQTATCVDSFFAAMILVRATGIEMNRQEQWRATPKSVFELATTENRDLHLAVMSVFADRELTDPALTLEDLLSALPQQAPDLRVDDASLRRSLDQLVEWKLLDESRNESATYRTPEEFQRRNLQWSLTAHGQTAVAILDEAARFLAAVASLQPAAIDSLAQSIARVVRLAADPLSDSAIIHVELQQAEHHHQSLVDNVRRFQSQLSHLLSDPTLDDAVMAQARDAIIEYLTRYIHDAEQPAARAAEALRHFHELGDAFVLERALAGANLAPDPVRGDPRPRWLEERMRRLAALDEWFLRTVDGSPPRIARLRARGRDWVLHFLRVMELRRAHRRRSASIIDDFTAIARAFAGCMDDQEATRLFVAAFELHGARHHTLAYDDVEALDPATPAAGNPAIDLTSTLRVQSTMRPRTRERPVGDPREQRARAAAEQASRLQRTAAMRAAILTDGTVHLSSYGRLEYEQFRDLVDLLCAALTALPLADGTRQCFSSDGQVEVIVYPPDTYRTCCLSTDAGTLTAPDFRLSVRLRGVDIATGTASVGSAAAVDAH